MFVQGFRHGDAAPLPDGKALFHAVFGPHIDRIEPEYHFWHVTAPDGGEADIYTDSESCNDMMLNHFSSGDVLNLLAEFAQRANAVIMPAGGPILLTSPSQREHLPSDLLDALPVILVASGNDIDDAIRSA